MREPLSAEGDSSPIRIEDKSVSAGTAHDILLAKKGSTES